MTVADSQGRSSYELERDWVHLSRLKNHALERLNKVSRLRCSVVGAMVVSITVLPPT